ncbi:MAG TPA: tetratricopeptide repeat protein, partial [Candidatus Methylomirabilis sp.]
KDPQLLAQLGDFYRERERFAEAIPLSLAATAIVPGDPRLWASLGLAYQGLGRHGEALDAFRRAITIDPDDPFYHYRSGLTLLAMKRLDEAAAALQTVALKDPTKPDPHLELGRVYRLQGKNAMALQSYRWALRLGPLNPEALRAVEELAAALDEFGS